MVSNGKDISLFESDMETPDFFIPKSIPRYLLSCLFNKILTF